MESELSDFDVRTTVRIQVADHVEADCGQTVRQSHRSEGRSRPLSRLGKYLLDRVECHRGASRHFQSETLVAISGIPALLASAEA